MKRQADLSSRTPSDGIFPAFHTREDGSLTIFGLLIFVMMMLAGGIALDIMRSDARRTEVQSAIDRAALASASLDQERDSEEVVRDYLRASGLDEDSVQVTVTNTGFDRTVLIEGDVTVNSLFLDALGVPQLLQPASSKAREVRTDLELSLVLDISGSMSGNKIAALRTSAKDFVEMLISDREDLTTVSLVPYNDRVNAGPVVGEAFNMTDEHDLSHCAVFSDAEFTQLGQANGDSLQRMGDFDFRTSYKSGNGDGLTANPNCRRDSYGAILPWSNDVALLQNRIENLSAGNWTAMDLGVKWGTLLLDPSSNEELSYLANSPDVPADYRVEAGFVGRPASYSDDGTHKVLVVMTDGVNTQQWDLKDHRKSGPSAVWVFREPKNANDDGEATGTLPRQTGGATSNPFWAGNEYCVGQIDSEAYSLCRAEFDGDDGGTYRVRYSVWSSRRGQFWIDHLDEWRNEPYGGDNAVRLGWNDVFSSISVSYLVNTIMRGSDYNTRVDYFYSWEETHDQARADQNLSNICAAALAQGIVIYTIAFQAPPDGRKAMRDCAGVGNEARYFDIANLDIDSAFHDILASVHRLRLVQ